MLELRRWGNGECRVFDTESLMASAWLRYEPQGALASIALDYDCGDPMVILDDEKKAKMLASGMPPPARRLHNTEKTISSKASDAEHNSWMPPCYEIVRVWPEAPHQVGDEAYIDYFSRKIVLAMHMDDPYDC